MMGKAMARARGGAMSGGRRLLRAAVPMLACSLLSGPAAAQDVVEYYQLDSVGNVLVVTNAQGAVVEERDYLPFGEELCGTVPCSAPTAGQPRRFTGKERDAETGLDYFGARYYRASHGRFTTVDPALNIPAALVDPQRWNRYAYGRNNPLRFLDPDGSDVILLYRPPSGFFDFGHMLLYARNDRTGAAAYFDYFPQNNETTVLNKPDQSRLDAHSSLTIETSEAQEQAILVNIKAFAEHPDTYNFTVTGSKTESTCTTQCTTWMSVGGLGEFFYRKPKTVWEKAYARYGDPSKGGQHPKPGTEYGRMSGGRHLLDEKAFPPQSLEFDRKGKPVE
jgi:RHS repeat-associated protein